MKIGFFGGCFNPVTIAHIKLIENVIKQNKLDKVYFVPMGNSYKYMKTELVDLKYRVEMLELALKDYEKIDVLNILEDESKRMHAIDTFKIIDKMFEKEKRIYIMGSDNYEDMINWKDSDKLFSNYEYIILDRNIESETKNISSSLVREKVNLEESIDGLVPDIVKEYIEKNGLYK